MNSFLRILMATSVVLSLSGTALTAADYGNENVAPPYEGPRVVLFERPNFRGESVEFKLGEEVPNLASITFSNGKRANDAVSSIYIEPGAIVTLNTDSRFRGESLRLSQSVENLADISTPSGGTWADAISSLRVEAAPVVVAPRRGGGAREDREPRVILYRDPNYRGEFLEVFPGENYDNLNSVSFDGGGNANDRISSVRVVGGVKLRAFSSSGYRDDAIEITEDISDLGSVSRSPNSSGTWVDCISSLRVERGVGRENEGDNNRDRDRDRGGYDRPGEDRGPVRPPPVMDNRPAPRPGEAEALINRIFRELLSRAPSEIEVREYRAHMYDDEWTAEMIRNDVRRTREFRQRDADNVITRAFQDLLGHKPDAQQMQDFRVYVLDRGWSDRQVRDRIRQSSEFIEKDRAQRTVAADAMITRLYRELLGREPDQVALTNYRKVILDGSFSERNVSDSIMGSDEYRERERTKKLAAADAMITRLYRELLGREPDEVAFTNYRRVILDGSFKEKNVRDSIMGSDEYRQRELAKKTAAADAIITRLYRELLGREPDEVAITNYRRVILDGSFTERNVRDSIMGSQEYLDAHPQAVAQPQPQQPPSQRPPQRPNSPHNPRVQPPPPPADAPASE